MPRGGEFWQDPCDAFRHNATSRPATPCRLGRPARFACLLAHGVPSGTLEPRAYWHH